MKEAKLKYPDIKEEVWNAVFHDSELKKIASFIIGEILLLHEKYVFDNIKFDDKGQKVKDDDLILTIAYCHLAVRQVLINNYMNSGEPYCKLSMINFYDIAEYPDSLIIPRVMVDTETNEPSEEFKNLKEYNINVACVRKKYENGEKLSKFEKIIAIMNGFDVDSLDDDLELLMSKVKDLTK